MAGQFKTGPVRLVSGGPDIFFGIKIALIALDDFDGVGTKINILADGFYYLKK